MIRSLTSRPDLVMSSVYSLSVRFESRFVPRGEYLELQKTHVAARRPAMAARNGGGTLTDALFGACLAFATFVFMGC